jgi:iron complex outermembrane receptor protein
MKKQFVTILLIVLSTNIFAQNYFIGLISDIKTKQNLPFARVYIPELNRNETTNKSGEFSLSNIPNGKFRVEFSCKGYETIIRAVRFSQTEITMPVKLRVSLVKKQNRRRA